MVKSFGNNKADINSDNTASGPMLEHASFVYNIRKFLAIALGVVSFVAVSTSFYINNCKYAEAFTGYEYGDQILPFVFYFILNMCAFLLLGVFSFLALGIKWRYDKLGIAKQNYKRDGRSYTDIEKERKSIKDIRRMESVIKTSKFFMVMLAVAAILLFVALFSLGGLTKSIIELSKKPVDRPVTKDPRVYADLFGQGFFTLSVLFGSAIIPPIMKDTVKLNKVFLGIVFALSVYPAVHYAYFFFGNITAHASPLDICAALVPAIVCGFIATYFISESRKKLISTFVKRSEPGRGQC
ncbi:MAG: hypothetical protein IJS71_04805 [Clostridia bacterium]|nr:hypothetical protein [Clostridia bacterium]